MRFLILALIAIHLGGTLSLSCLPCTRKACRPVGDCPYGVGRDICGCCEKCLKGPGEVCGGSWNNNGRCGEGLDCEFDEDYDFPHIANQPDGTCVYQQEAAPEVIREKRSPNRRQGQKLITAKTHKHVISGSSIPEHVLRALRKQGIDV